MKAYRVQRTGDSREVIVCGRVGRHEEERSQVRRGRKERGGEGFRDTRRAEQNTCLVV